jgi:hypothetical protein
MDVRGLVTIGALLLAGACAGSPAALPQDPAQPVFDAHVEHRADDCAARAASTRCFDESHWQYRIGDRVLRTHDELRSELRALGRRFPESDDEHGFFSTVTLHIRADPDASYASLQRLIQLASGAGIVCLDFPLTPDPQATVRAPPSGSYSPRDPEIRVALHWDAQNQRTRIQIRNEFLQDATELSAAITAAFTTAGDRPLTLIVDAADLVPWSEVARVIGMAPGARLELAAGRHFQ